MVTGPAKFLGADTENVPSGWGFACVALGDLFDNSPNEESKEDVCP